MEEVRRGGVVPCQSVAELTILGLLPTMFMLLGCRVEVQLNQMISTKRWRDRKRFTKKTRKPLRNETNRKRPHAPFLSFLLVFGQRLLTGTEITTQRKRRKCLPCENICLFFPHCSFCICAEETEQDCQDSSQHDVMWGGYPDVSDLWLLWLYRNHTVLELYTAE